MSLDPRWLEGVDIDLPVSEFLEPAFLEAEAEIAFTIEELEYLVEQGNEYTQELYEQGLLGDLPPLDMPDHLLDQVQDKNHDFGR